MNDKISNRSKAIQLQKRIFRTLRNEVRVLLGPPPPSIQKYERENQIDFKTKKLSPLTKSELIQSVCSVDVTFIADFHTFDQSQRTALRIIREAWHAAPDASWYIGLELIPSQFQQELDNFQSGKLPLDSFHKLISYESEWGFPWRNYLPIFDWARENRVRLIALNRPKIFFPNSENLELLKRDEWAAGIITDLVEAIRPTRPKIIVIYGELHVGTRHLPRSLHQVSKRALKKPLSWVTIHQNEEKVFWYLEKHPYELHTPVVRLRKNVFCVLSSPPWIKLQSLVSFLEGDVEWHTSPPKAPIEEKNEENSSRPEDEERETEDYGAHEPDYLSIFASYGRTIAEFLEIPPPSYEDLNLFTFSQIDFLNSLEAEKSLSAAEIRLIRFHVKYNQKIYIPKMRIAYLASPSLNGVAELASMHLLRSRNPWNSLPLKIQNEEDFYRRILEMAFGFLGSLILNPRRKCDLADDHRRRIKDLRQGEKPAVPHEQSARTLAMKWIQHSSSNLESSITRPFRIGIFTPAAKMVGQVLGLKLHRATLAERISLQEVRSLFFRMNENSAKDQYLHFFQYVGDVPTPDTKMDHL